MPERPNSSDLPPAKEVNLPPSCRNPLLHPGPLSSVLLACLFASGDPVDRPTLAEKLCIEEKELGDALSDLKIYLETGPMDSLMIVESGDLVQICVRPQYMTPIMATRNPKVKRLSDAALETIAIIAMKQPCTRKEIEDMRQKDCEGTIATLLEARFIQDIQRGRRGKCHFSGRWARDLRRSLAQYLRSLLHDQEARPRHRPGPEHLQSHSA